MRLCVKKLRSVPPFVGSNVISDGPTKGLSITLFLKNYAFRQIFTQHIEKAAECKKLTLKYFSLLSNQVKTRFIQAEPLT